MKTTSQSVFLKRAGITLALALVFAIPAIATSGVWKWVDESWLLPYRDGVSINIASARQNTWMLSDGTHAYQFDGTAVQDMTSALRSRNILTVSGIFSDDRNWLIHSQSTDQGAMKLWLTDGQSWTDLSGTVPQAPGGLDAVGNNATWYVRTYTRATVGEPSFWELYSWNGVNTPVRILPPNGVATVQSGCFSYADKSTLCTGVSTPLFVNGAWYFVGGTSEARGAESRASQTATSGMWRLQGNGFSAISGVPNFKFVSAVWASEQGALIATSQAATNAFAADHLWLFDGTTWKDVSSQALAMGLLSMDAREIHAAWNGRSWMILAGKKQIRFDGVRMTNEGNTRDLFRVVSGNGSGQFVLGGAAAEPDQATPNYPLSAKFALVTENLSASAAPSAPLVSGVVSEILSKIYGPQVTVSSSPTDAHVGNGKVFVFRAVADDQNGVQRIDMYVHGTRVKSCQGNACEYTQRYWTNGAAIRQVQLFARAIGQDGYANESDRVTLVVEANSQTSAFVADNAPSFETTPAVSLPVNQRWTADHFSGINWASWLQDTNGAVVTVNPGTLPKLMSGGSFVYSVAANDAKGLSRMDLWVNGAIKKTCTLQGQKDTQVCSVTLSSMDYPYGTEVFVNANVFDSVGKSVWTSGTRARRDTSPLTIAVVAPTPTPAVTTPGQVAGPIFGSTIAVDPNSPSVVRGTVIKVYSSSQNNLTGLQRVEVYANGKIARTCSFGAVVSPSPCDITVDTASVNEGTTYTFMARAINADGQEVWSGSKAMIVRSASSGSPTASANGMSVWTWMGPSVSELSEGQTADYSVGAWAPSGIAKIEMVVDGTTRRTCSPATSGAKECTYTITTYDYTHGHTVAINARVTDNAGQVMWTEPHNILIKRNWEPLLPNRPYVTVTTSADKGYKLGDKIQFTVRGWAGTGINYLDLFVNGKKVASCSSEACAWTSDTYYSPQIEYAARMLDHENQETWTPVAGFYKK
ncbi:hypothetical protein EXS71_01760 [Candidatus Uhrbacteria bacterium]|nr:hypothetical protein [Candidatus Uhrbacteria bacterium]